MVVDQIMADGSEVGYMSFDHLSMEMRLEEDEEEFRSCYGDDEVWKETEELGKEELGNEFDDVSVKMFFKGVSMANAGDSDSGLSGIGVLMERSASSYAIQVQKKLGFFVDELVVDYLALLDGLVEAVRNKVRRVYAFTDSELLYDQITKEEAIDTPLLSALRQRILEHASNLETFVLNLTTNMDLEKPLRLAQVAIGVVSSPAMCDSSFENCPICREDKPLSMVTTMKCSHKFCSRCLKTYVDGKVQSSQVPIRCPQVKCKYYISASECKSFLPVISYKSLEKALAEANVRNSDRIYCPFPNCSALLDLRGFLSSSQSDDNSVECHVCRRFFCVECRVPWHSSLSCREFQNLPPEERDVSDIALHLLAGNKKWRRCQQCRMMIELAQGCYHITCWCGHEFCYSCGAEYRDCQQTCRCAFWDEDDSEDLVTRSMEELGQWACESFSTLSMEMNAYSDEERSQLELVQKFLDGDLV